MTGRGTTSKDDQGSSEDRKRRRAYLLDAYSADVVGIRVTYVDRPMLHLATSLIGTSELLTPSPENFAGVWETKRRVQEVHGHIESIERVPLCRCFRCGALLTFETLTVDRIVPGCLGGRYVRTNIRPACSRCNTGTGAGLASLASIKTKKEEAAALRRDCPTCRARRRERCLSASGRRVKAHATRKRKP